MTWQPPKWGELWPVEIEDKDMVHLSLVPAKGSGQSCYLKACRSHNSLLKDTKFEGLEKQEE